MQLDDSAAGEPHRLRVGEVLRITLPETQTTGYHWRLVSSCGAVLEPAAQDDAHGEMARPGASSLHVWHFVAGHAGACELRFESVRSWEPSAAGKVLVFPVTVVPR